MNDALVGAFGPAAKSRSTLCLPHVFAVSSFYDFSASRFLHRHDGMFCCTLCRQYISKSPILSEVPNPSSEWPTRGSEHGVSPVYRSTSLDSYRYEHMWYVLLSSCYVLVVHVNCYTRSRPVHY